MPLDKNKANDMFLDLHEKGAAKYGWNWLQTNTIVRDACLEVGIDVTDTYIKLALTLSCFRLLATKEKEKEA